MIGVFMTIVNNWLMVNYYQKELLFRCGSGPYARKRFSSGTEFSHPKWKHNLQQN